MLPGSVERVPEHTPGAYNERIRRQTERNIAYFRDHPEQIEYRLEELDHEWDIERTLETNAATLALSGSLLALLGDRRWAILPAAVMGFLLQHGLQGWCPPVPFFRRRGFRTPREIEAERYALKMLRGDYEAVEKADILQRIHQA